MNHVDSRAGGPGPEGTESLLKRLKIPLDEKIEGLPSFTREEGGQGLREKIFVLSLLSLLSLSPLTLKLALLLERLVVRGSKSVEEPPRALELLRAFEDTLEVTPPSPYVGSTYLLLSILSI